MGNKLKQAFSKKNGVYEGIFKFDSNESYMKFVHKMNKLKQDGIPFNIEGKVQVLGKLKKDNDCEYDVVHLDNVKNINVELAKEKNFLDIDTVEGNKRVSLLWSRFEGGYILQSDDNAIVSIKVICLKKEDKIRFSYDVRLNFADNSRQVAESYNDAIGVLNKLFCTANAENEKDVGTFKELQDSFLSIYLFWNHLSKLEDLLKIKIKPNELKITEELMYDIEELYLLLIEKKFVRINQKVLSGTLKFSDDELHDKSIEEKIKEDDKLSISFRGEKYYTIDNHKAVVYTMNFLCNVIVKSVKKISNNEIQIYYKDLDSMPMYIIYNGYLNQKELDNSNSSDLSVVDDVLTVEDYYKQTIKILKDKLRKN